MFLTFIETQRDKLDIEELNIDGTHSLMKKSAEGAAYQYRKKAKASNIRIMSDGKGMPIATVEIISENHNDLYRVVPQFSRMIRQLRNCSFFVENSLLNSDKDFDCKKLIRAYHRRKLFSNIIENKRHKKEVRRGRKRFFNQEIYQKGFVNKRCLAWIDSFRILLMIRFGSLDSCWLNWHLLLYF